MLETQGINPTNQYETTAPKNKAGKFIQQAKVKATELKDKFENSSPETKGKINAALAGSAAIGTVLTLFATSGKKVVVENLKNSAKNTFKKQNAPVKWLGAAISIISSATIAVLNIKFSNTNQKQEITKTAESSTTTSTQDAQ